MERYLSDKERIVALEERLSRLERENALLAVLTPGAPWNVREYRPVITNGPGGIPLD